MKNLNLNFSFYGILNIPYKKINIQLNVIYIIKYTTYLPFCFDKYYKNEICIILYIFVYVYIF